jgi:hypothetical protein
MAEQIKVYSFSVLLNSQIAMGNHSGSSVNVAALDPDSARAILDSTLDPTDVANITGGTMVLDGVYLDTNIVQPSAVPKKQAAPSAPSKHSEDEEDAPSQHPETPNKHHRVR